MVILGGSNDHSLRLWDLATGKCLRIFEGCDSGVASVMFSPDGHLALVNRHRLLDVTTGKCLCDLIGPSYVTCATFLPDGRFVLSGSDDKTLQLWDVATGKCLRIFEGHTSSVKSVAFSPDGHFALSGSWDKTVRLWELTTGKCLCTFEGHTDVVTSVAFSPDGRFALSFGGETRVWELDWEYEYDPVLKHRAEEKK